jgi:hypothetical protein
MPVPDQIHNAVRNALIKDGWTITADPYRIHYEDALLYADLAAERPLAAERGDRRIVVEIKSFLGPSLHHDLQAAIGQYEIYRGLLEVTAPDRELFLAISDAVYVNFFERKSVQLIVRRFQIRLVVIQLATEEIERWIN